MTLRRVQVSPMQPGNQVNNEQSRARAKSSENVLHTSRCVKYTMFFKNMFFLLCGVFVGAIGIAALQEKGKLRGQFDGFYLDPAAIMLTVGSIVVIVSFCGALGALRENKCLLRFFYACVTLLILLQLAVGLAAYFAKDSVKSKIDDVFQKAIRNYQDDLDLQSLIDYIQSELGCCGSIQPTDWNANPYFNCSSVYKAQKSHITGSFCSVPHSCCRNDMLNRKCGFGVFGDHFTEDDRKEKIYTTGCIEALEKWFKDHALYAGIVCGFVLILQVVSVKLAFRMIAEINDIIKWRERFGG